MTELVQAIAAHQFSAPAERVFDAWLNPADVRAWLSQPIDDNPGFDVRRVETDPRVGGRFTFSDQREQQEAVHWGYYREIDRPATLEFTWFTSEDEEREDSSVVRLTLSPLPQGCEATIVHSMDERYAQWVEQTARGWTMLMRKIDLAVGGE
ncbi:SRPBCC family protein [Mycolicibacterium brisbanense]|uniref:Activator of Hsp90 ATPase homologue 1/2-like C-terminal domain-containing protein n=1 Tax=Mycolicibacterium brisbanense TaxID=146020 RepID=A0A100VYZ7_9MYCO|nr:SRPBCC domain-containing protein [Mycolicibacterium brisbanense]MCV7158756.1 SRPBCC domain-containing protein [Mycolicibacterium brisbanense]GAS88606.1 uncharacterized protein RMCB_2702 [Mycolicibacterium brisbanense]